MSQLSNNAPSPHLRDILGAVLQAFPDTSRADLLSPSRKHVHVRPRQIAMTLSRELTPASLPRIGKFYGGRDHTTVIHATRRVPKLCDMHPELDIKVGLLRIQIMRTIAPEDGTAGGFRASLRQSVRDDPDLQQRIDPAKLAEAMQP